MSLADFVSLVDDKLRSAYEAVTNDPTKARKAFARSLEREEKRFGEGRQPRGDNKLWSAQNNIVEFTPRFDGNPISINGSTALLIPAERFPDALKRLIAATNAGELDDQLTGSSTVSTSTRKPRANAGVKRGPLSEEALAARRAKVAARKAAEAKA